MKAVLFKKKKERKKKKKVSNNTEVECIKGEGPCFTHLKFTPLAKGHHN